LARNFTAMMLPSFLRLPIYAFELSDKSYKYLRLKEERGGIVLDDFGEGEIAAGGIEHGEIKKKDFWKTSSLRELKRVNCAKPWNCNWKSTCPCRLPR